MQAESTGFKHVQKINQRDPSVIPLFSGKIFSVKTRPYLRSSMHFNCRHRAYP